MDFPEELITPKEVNDYPKHYIGELIDEKGDSFLLYQYAPGLLTSFGALADFDKKYDKIKNPVLQFLTNIATFKNIVESPNITYHDAKKRIQLCINRDCTIYKDRTQKIGLTILENVRSKQHEDRSLESAMLSCAPIVQYAKTTLVKPEMTEENLYDKYFKAETIPVLPSKQEFDKIIKEYLVNHVLDILSHGEFFIDPSNSDARIRDLISLNSVKSESEKNAAVYFLLVFLRYVSGFNDWNDILTRVFNLNMICNKISNGERVSIGKAIEAFNQLS